MSDLEQHFEFQLNVSDLIGFEREYKFHPTRKWRADFCWPEEKLIVEVEGGTFSGGRHTNGKGFEADCEKYNTAVCMGYAVLRGTSKHVKSGELLAWVSDYLEDK